jgi:DNA repair protein RadD
MIQLYPDQESLAQAIRVSMADHNKTLAVAPTGFGKTILFSYITSRARERGKRIGIFAHRAELTAQISEALRRFRVPHGIIGPGGRAPDLRHSVFVISAQTYARRVGDMPEFDLGIVDEAHHATSGSTWGQCMARSPNAKWLGVTATPERLDGRGLKETFESMVMGPTTAELIAMGRLSRYRLFAPGGMDTSGVHTLGGDFNRGELAEAADKPGITGNAIDHYRKYLDGAPTVAFCVGIAHASHVAESFRDAGYSAASIDGKMDPTDRARIVRDFKSGAVSVLTSSDLISEGFDLPGMMGAILLRPTKSLSLYLQQVGRALRAAPGKEAAVILDHAGNSDPDRHGLPCQDREWSLEGRAKGSEKAAVSAYRECGVCFTRVPMARSECPECKTVFPIHMRKIEEREGELGEVDVEARREEVKKQISPERREQGMTKTLEGLADLFRRQMAEKLGRPLTDEEAQKQFRRAGHVMRARQAKAPARSDWL